MISKKQMEIEAESLYYVKSLTRAERKNLEVEILSHPERFCGDTKTYILRRALINTGLLGRGSDGKGGETLGITDMGRSFLKAKLQ